MQLRAVYALARFFNVDMKTRGHRSLLCEVFFSFWKVICSYEVKAVLCTHAFSMLSSHSLHEALNPKP